MKKSIPPSGDFITPAELAERLRLPELKHGACIILGKTMRFSPDDVKNLLEALRPPSALPSADPAPLPNTFGTRLPQGGYDELVKLLMRQKHERGEGKGTKKRQLKPRV